MVATISDIIAANMLVPKMVVPEKKTMVILRFIVLGTNVMKWAVKIEKRTMVHIVANTNVQKVVAHHRKNSILITVIYTTIRYLLLRIPFLFVNCAFGAG